MKRTFFQIISKNMSLETTSLCLHTRLRVNKKFHILIFYIETNLTFDF